MKVLELSPDKQQILQWLNDVSPFQQLDVMEAEDGTLCLDAEVAEDAKRTKGAWTRWKGFLDSLPVKEKPGKLRMKNSDPDPLGLLKNL